MISPLRLFRGSSNIPKPTPKIPGVTPQLEPPGEQAVNAILAKAHELSLGLAQPESLLVQQTPPPRDDGYWQHFERGWVYWTARTGAQLVSVDVFAKWAELKWEQGFLGFPVSDTLATSDGAGQYNHFENGSIYWSRRTGAWEVHGAIRDKWASLGWERSFLGYPVSDETPARDGIGRFNHFQGGSIYWRPETGAYEVHGAIRELWLRLDAEQSRLGYPTTDETPAPDNIGRFNNFQHGSIVWDPELGAREVMGDAGGAFQPGPAQGAPPQPDSRTMTAPQPSEPAPAQTQTPEKPPTTATATAGSQPQSTTPAVPAGTGAETTTPADTPASTDVQVSTPLEIQPAPAADTTSGSSVTTGPTQPGQDSGTVDAALGTAGGAGDSTISTTSIAPEGTITTTAPPAAPEPYVAAPPRRMDFAGTRTLRLPLDSSPYSAGTPLRIDFAGRHTMPALPPPSAPYEAAPPLRIDFQGSHSIGHQ